MATCERPSRSIFAACTATSFSPSLPWSVSISHHPFTKAGIVAHIICTFLHTCHPTTLFSLSFSLPPPPPSVASRLLDCRRCACPTLFRWDAHQAAHAWQCCWNLAATGCFKDALLHAAASVPCACGLTLSTGVPHLAPPAMLVYSHKPPFISILKKQWWYAQVRTHGNLQAQHQRNETSQLQAGASPANAGKSLPQSATLHA